MNLGLFGRRLTGRSPDRLNSFSLALLVGALLTLWAMPGVCSAAFPGDTGPFVVEQNDDGQSKIFTVDPDGTAKNPLTTEGQAIDPALNAGSTKIVFAGNIGLPTRRAAGRRGVSEDVQQIYIMNFDGSGIQQLTHSSVNHRNRTPYFSQDGDWVVFLRDNGEGGDDVWKIKTDGTGNDQLTTYGNDRAPVFSPDGTKIAFFRDQELWTMDADGSNEALLATSARTYFGGTRPSYSPDGSQIAFTAFSTQEPDLVSGIHRVNSADGSNRTLLIAGNETDNPMYSSDGTQLAFLVLGAPGRRAATGGGVARGGDPSGHSKS